MFSFLSYHRDGLCVMDSREMPASLAAWKIFPSTSMLTALVHSSKRAYLGLKQTKQIVCMIASHPVGHYERFEKI